MLKDSSDKREEDIDRLVSRLADALTPKITRHIEKYGLPGNTHGLVFDPNRGKKFSIITLKSLIFSTMLRKFQTRTSGMIFTLF